MKNIQKFMKQAEEMQAKFTEIQAKLEEEETEGSSGGGLVKVTLTGKNVMKRITLDPGVLADKEMLEDLIVAAHNDARTKVEANFNDKMGQLAGGLSMPPGFKMPF